MAKGKRFPGFYASFKGNDGCGKSAPAATASTRTSFLNNPWVVRIAGGVITGILLYFLLGKN